MITSSDFYNLQLKFPFLSCIRFRNEDLVGIIQNMDSQVVSFYVYNHLNTAHEKTNFLNLGQDWWDNSNRLIPIDIFLKEDFEFYKKIHLCFPKKEISNIMGHTVCLDDQFNKRIKKRRTQLVRVSKN